MVATDTLEISENTELSAPEEFTFHEKVHAKFESLGLPTWMVQLFLFGLIGASGIFVDLAVVVVCREVFHLNVLIGIYPAFVVAVTWNYELNRRITFDSRGVSWWYAYVTFFLACSLGLLVRLVFVSFLIKTLGFDDRFLQIGSWEVPYLRLSYVAYVGGIVVAYIINFLGSKYVAFRKSEG